MRHLIPLLMLILAGPVAAQTARLEPQKIYVDDVTRLIVEQASRIPSLHPLDTALLEKDFEILDRKSRVYKQSDGQGYGNRMEWQLELLPRRSGRLSIPPLSIGGNLTPPLTLEVIPAAKSDKGQSIFIEIESSPAVPYVGQQVNLVMRLLHNTPILRGRWREPEMDSADIFRGIRESNYQVRRDGEDFNVLERELTLFPRRPGIQKIPEVSYRGLIDPGHDPAGIYLEQEYRMLNRKSRARQLRVLDIPPDYQGSHWLPAKRLELSQVWDGIDAKLRPGDTISRRLVIAAAGLPAKALPTGVFESPDDRYRIFADRAERSSRFSGKDLVSRVEQTYAIVVYDQGQIELPALELKWWNVDLDREQTSYLPGKVIQVTAAAVGTLSPGERSTLVSYPGADSSDSLSATAGRLILSLIITLLLGWLVWGQRISRFVATRLEHRYERRLRWQTLRRACHANHPGDARLALLAWARLCWSDDSINSLRQIDQRSSSNQLGQALQELDAAVYADDARNWNGIDLWRHLQRANTVSKPARLSTEELPPLYPALRS